MSAMMPVTAAPPAPPAPPETPSFPVYRLSVPQYLAMVEHGILSGEDRVELLAGILVETMSKNPPHRVATRKIRRLLEALLPAGWFAESQEPIVLANSVPEPDVVVARAELEADATRHPGAADVSLVIEVADTTLVRDRGTKKGLYADAKIPTYWIVNLVDSVLEIYSDPVGGDYATSRVLTANDEAVVVVAGQEVGRVAVRDLLP